MTKLTGQWFYPA